MPIYSKNNVNFSHQMPFTQRPEYAFESNSKYISNN